MLTLSRVSRAVRTVAVATGLLLESFGCADALGAIHTQVDEGEEIFRTTCFACHTIGAGRLVGPDLQGVTGRHSEDWIIGFVQHSEAVIASEDPAAVALREDYPGLIMPDQPYSPDQIKAVLDYTRAGFYDPFAAAGPLEATEEQILLGGDLFQGRLRFANRGPTCNSCHEVVNDAVIGGGGLAAELTSVFSRVGGPGVRAIIGSSPFPVMQRAYQGRPLTDDEVTALAGFLRQADAEQAFQRARYYGVGLFTGGVAGAFLLLSLYSLVWSGRSKGAVNQAIYDRQVKST